MIRRAALLLALLALPLRAQVAPNARWRTLRTEHGRIHFAAGNEDLARRTAANFERAYTLLAQSLHPPRGTVDVVLSDDVDFSNGYATPLPSNRIVIYAAPPVDAGSLRFVEDWNELVVTHELTHIFHLDRARGIWGLGQRVFGRAPFLFPNLFGPSWLTEGLAVWEESQLTAAGRLEGTQHRMVAHAAALSGHVPRLDEVSLATPRFPGGEVAYIYGSLFIEYLSRQGGQKAIRDFVDAQSSQLIPIWLDRPAKRAFGTTLARAWQHYADSLVATAGADSAPLGGWTALIRGDLAQGAPRWSGDSLLQAASSGRYPLAIRTARPDGRVRRGDRRWSDSPQVPLADGSVLYAQLDYRDPYHLRSDLWIERASGERRRITTGARLTDPDARKDGEIVAVQGQPGSTRLVRVSADGRRIVPITTSSLDTNWSEPRWSPDGTRLAAVRWARGAITEIVVLDSTGRALRTLAGGRAVYASPSWSPDGARVLFTSDETGAQNVYVADVAEGGVAQVTHASTNVNYPQLSLDGRTLAAVRFRADGYELGVAPMPTMRLRRDDTAALAGAASRPVARDTIARVERYSPVRTLLPRWWMPLAESGLGDGTRIGALTGGRDVVGRHEWLAEVLVPTDNSGIVGDATWLYSGLGLPLLDVSVSQDWTNRGTVVSDAGTPLGVLRRRIQDASLGATWTRPRVRDVASVTVAAGVESRHYATDPPALIDEFDPPIANIVRPRVLVGASWTRAQRAPWAISTEDGVTISASALRRWRQGVAGSASHTGIASMAGYKSLDLPGFSRHVLAARVAGGVTDSHTTSALEVGGTSGSVLALVPGYSLGEGRETFGVRGFPSAALTGLRATAGSVEYRAPLGMIARGWRLWPMFLDRTSLAFFADGGAAYCPAAQARQLLCTYTGADSLPPVGTPAPNGWQSIASVGAELQLSAAVLSWDQPYRFRFGVAAPVKGREFTGVEQVRAYVAVGLAY